MVKKHTIAIDMMSGDEGASVSCKAVVEALKQGIDENLLLIGHKESIERELEHHACRSDSITIISTEDVVAMTDNPLKALRHKRSSSMWKAIELVNEGTADACVSAGNTGALMAMSRYLLKTVDGVSRPAICSYLPSESEEDVLVLDLGANVDCEPEHLLQFAIMGSDSHPASSPRVGLLANGSEDIKGNKLVKAVHGLLLDSDKVNYVGYIEGHQIFQGDADVIVCDGFVGNAVLKSCEGVASMVKREIMRAINKSWFGSLLSPLFRKMLKKFEGKSRGAAVLLGLKGTVVKTHGAASHQEFLSGILEAIRNARKKMSRRQQCYAK